MNATGAACGSVRLASTESTGDSLRSGGSARVGLPGCSSRGRDYRREAASVGAAPVHPPAVGAAAELVIGPPGSGEKLRLDLALGHLGQRPVTGDAARPRRERRGESAEYICQLLVGASAAHV